MVMLSIKHRLQPLTTCYGPLPPFHCRFLSGWPWTRHVQTPYQPWDDEVAWFDQGGGDDGECGGNEPYDGCADSVTWFHGYGGVRRQGKPNSVPSANFRLPWVISIGARLVLLLRWRLDVGQSTKAGDGCPGADEVDGYGKILR